MCSKGLIDLKIMNMIFDMQSIDMVVNKLQNYAPIPSNAPQALTSVCFI